MGHGARPLAIAARVLGSKTRPSYSPVGGSPSLGAQVNRQSLPDGSTAIVAKFWCDNPFGCIPKADVTLNQFTATVNAAH